MYKPPTLLVYVNLHRSKPILHRKRPTYACSELALYATYPPAQPTLEIALRAGARLESWRRAAPGPRGTPLAVDVKECLKSSRL